MQREGKREREAKSGEGRRECSTPPTVSVSYGKVSMLPLYCLLYISVSLVRAPEGAKQSAPLSALAERPCVCAYMYICVPCVCVKSCYVLRLN